jgi:hypothetical protein
METSRRAELFALAAAERELQDDDRIASVERIRQKPAGKEAAPIPAAESVAGLSLKRVFDAP